MTEYKLEEISISKLKLDKKNPRIPQSLHNKDEGEIITYMIINASITELMESICKNNYFSGEPLIIVPENLEAPDGNYIVVEGNRRATALKLLHHPELAKVQKNKIQAISTSASCQKPNKIPSLIAKDHNEVQRYLGFKHITGIKSWKALEKARYLNHLKNNLLDKDKNLKLTELSKELASMIGSRSDYVRRVLVAYDIYLIIEENNFFDIQELNDTTFYFTNLVDSLNRKNIARFLNVDLSKNKPIDFYKEKPSDTKNIKEWCQWLFEKNQENQTRVKGVSSQLTMLASIIGNEKALEEFREGKSLKEAAFSTEHAEIVFSGSVRKSIGYLKSAFSVAYNINDFPASLDDDLQEIVKICRDIKNIKESRGKDLYEL